MALTTQSKIANIDDNPFFKLSRTHDRMKTLCMRISTVSNQFVGSEPTADAATDRAGQRYGGLVGGVEQDTERLNDMLTEAEYQLGRIEALIGPFDK